MKTITKLWLFIVILIILVPIGLILPAYFKAGPAWGEWTAADRYGKTSLTYIISGAIGVIVITGIALLTGKFLSRKK